LLWFGTREEIWYYAYLGAIAAATSDTWGTELGVLSNKPPFLVSSFQRVRTGHSGAISTLGVLSGLLGALSIWLSALIWLNSPLSISFFSIILSGLIGSLADSLIGATIQVQYKCMECNELTEQQTHCGKEGTVARGLAWMKNDQVNFLCTLLGALTSVIFFLVVSP
jgi:uncharacterized protein (TIGR00297 family)